MSQAAKQIPRETAMAAITQDESSSLVGRKIGLMNNDDWSMLIFRAGLVRQLLSRGADVVLFVPPGKSVPRLEALGVRDADLHLLAERLRGAHETAPVTPPAP